MINCQTIQSTDTPAPDFDYTTNAAVLSDLAEHAPTSVVRNPCSCSSSYPMSDTPSKATTLKSWKKRSTTILLVSESGVGKTAFLDLLSNICAGRTLEEFQQVHTEGDKPVETRGQYSKPLLHTIACANGCELRLLDLQCSVDSLEGQGSGVLDLDHARRAVFVEAIREKIETIDSVVMLVNGTTPRHGVSTDLAMNMIYSIFPGGMVDNIGIMINMVPTPLHFNFDLEALYDPLRTARKWAFDNPCAAWFKYQGFLQQAEPPEASELEGLRKIIEKLYSKTMETLNDFFEWQDERIAQPAKTFSELHRLSLLIDSTATDLLSHAKQIREKEAELERLKRGNNVNNEVGQITERIKGLQARVEEAEEQLLQLCADRSRLYTKDTIGRLLHERLLLQRKYTLLSLHHASQSTLSKIQERIVLLEKRVLSLDPTSKLRQGSEKKSDVTLPIGVYTVK